VVRRCFMLTAADFRVSGAALLLRRYVMNDERSVFGGTAVLLGDQRANADLTVAVH